MEYIRITKDNLEKEKHLLCDFQQSNHGDRPCGFLNLMHKPSAIDGFLYGYLFTSVVFSK